MNCGKTKLLIGLVLVFAGMILGPGCAPNGYITASVQSVVGLDVSENPQTQMPHVRFGFVRSQFYYIPTGKVVVSGGPVGSGLASETPELVSDIHVKMEFLQSGEIKEKFAVGPVAVTTGTAKIMFADKEKPNIVYDDERNPLRIKIGNIVSKDTKKAEAAKEWIIARNSKLSNNKYPIETFTETATYSQLTELLHFLEGTK